LGLLLINNGTIRGGVRETSVDPANNTIVNHGAIFGQIELDNGDIVRNTGTMHDDVLLFGANLFTNKGTVLGDIHDGSGGGGDTLINRGTIAGDVILHAGTNILDSSHGHLLGTVMGGTGADTLIGGVDDDTLSGGLGIDTLAGGAGDDILSGGGQRDTLTGGRGDDTMSGGAAVDTFKFSGEFGHDTITDFTGGPDAGHDIIRFALDDFTSFGELTTHVTTVGSDTVITLDSGDTIVLQHTSTISAEDFLFG
jgi:Ca2+-binding RTX toxin-like protein